MLDPEKFAIPKCGFIARGVCFCLANTDSSPAKDAGSDDKMKCYSTAMLSAAPLPTDTAGLTTSLFDT
jgi:hypothetical protein